jgi:serine/threonine protein kinase/WD40 repeat protein
MDARGGICHRFAAVPSSRDVVPQVADYELVRLIGSGSYGDVWLARSVTGAFRAIKFVWRDRFNDVRPYEREFEGITRFTAVSLREPSQLALLHVGRDESAAFFYYVMELADDATRGRDIVASEYVALTLREVSQRRGRLPPSEVIALGVALSRALASLHAAGLVHRDIKPSNVVFVGGVPKLADVGLVAAASAGLTFVGTEGYVPPEGPGAPSADVFSLGKVLYELSTGNDRQEYPRLPADLSAVTDRKAFLELNEVIIRACEQNATKRFPDAGALLEELLLLQAGKSVRRLRSAEKRTAQALRMAAVLALVAGIAGTGAWVERRRANEELALREKAEADRDLAARHEVYSASLTQAERALDHDEYGRARQFLRAAIPSPSERDLRGFEWHALWNEAKGDRAIVVKESGVDGFRARYSPQAKLLAARTVTGSQVILWDADSLQEIRRIDGVGQFWGFTEGARYVVGATRNLVSRWRSDTGALAPGNSFRAIWALGPGPDDSWISIDVATGGGPLKVESHDMRNGDLIWRREIPDAPVDNTAGSYYASALSHDATRCAIAFLYRTGKAVSWKVGVYSLPDLRPVWSSPAVVHRPVVSFGKDNNALICTWDDIGEIELIEIEGNRRVWNTKLPMTRLTSVDNNGKTLAVAGRSGSIVLLSLETGEIFATKRGHEVDVLDVSFVPHTNQLLSTGSGGDIRLWSLDSDEQKQTLKGFWNPPGGGRTICTSPAGHWIAATAPLPPDALGNINPVTRVVGIAAASTPVDYKDCPAPVGFRDEEHLWLLRNGPSLEERSVHEPEVATKKISLPFTPAFGALSENGKRLAAFSIDARLVFAGPDDTTVPPAIDSGHGYPYWIALSSDGTLAATSGRDLSVRLWDTSSGRRIAEWKMNVQIVNGAFSPDKRVLALVQTTGVVEVRDLSGHRPPIHVVTSSGILQAVSYAPTEARLVVGGRDGEIHVIDTNRWNVITQMRADIQSEKTGTVSRTAFSRDGTLLCGYTEGGTIRLWRR